MLDVRYIKENTAWVKERLALKGKNYDAEIDRVLELDQIRRELILKTDQDKAIRNQNGKLVPIYKKEGKDTTELQQQMRALADEIKANDQKLAEAEEELRGLLLLIPNVPDASVPAGAGAEDNVVIRTWGEPRQFDFEPKPHWDLGKDLDIIDSPRGTKVAGTRFNFLKGAGAALERALLNFFVGSNVKAGYTELITPYMANTAALTGTAQLPKFKEDMYHLDGTDYYLISTAEIPLTNYHMGEILEASDMPIKYTACTPCFRSEAGAAGRDTRGLIRVHQFHKVEIMRFALPENSMNDLEDLTAQAESLLQALNLPYRVVFCCTGDMGSNQVKQYDIEVWMPSYGKYVEISSCSNYLDFQARRANIRFRREKGGKTEFVHTLNGSSLPGARAVAAVMENYQNADGTITVPEVLRPFMGIDLIK